MTFYTSEIRLSWGLGRVAGGDWDHDENCNRLRETTTYRGLKQRFEERYDWEETALYRRAKRRFEIGSTVRRYDSIEAYRNSRCEYLDELYHSIKRDGYRPNKVAGHDNPHEDAYAHKLDPLVVIGRSGEICWTEGYHRFVIASILDIDEIPVYVLCRHEEW
ncbi:hypothetical protein [Haladaptatus sp. DFWS20]|uniref:hypothetical protein n=1 Tax=Haladaptatus sp. DFWS20 TaxID=3403467 RepID=UPI003EBDC865